ncbi:MAG: thiol reductant ABC exporter subunit CydC [Alphaproteobacteria bacterium]|nr:thiol reductant ABC exporter subunit CydC [Alphaproteobacteria bacterium]
MTALRRIFGLWRGRWLALGFGLLVSLAALLVATAMMTLSGAMVVSTGAMVAAPPLMRLLGPARVVLRYFERLATHDAMFRALADVRVWFFRGLARGAAGGIGYRRSADLLARLVNDVDALDGVYLRILIPLAHAAILLPVLLWQIGRGNILLALVAAALFAVAAFYLPYRAALVARSAGMRLGITISALRVAVFDTLHGLREVRAFAAEGRMLALIQSREAALFAAQHEVSGRAAVAQAGALLCGQAMMLAVIVTVSFDPAIAVAAFLAVAAFEPIAGLARAGVLAGHAAASAERVIAAAETPGAGPDPATPVTLPRGSALRFEGVQFRWQADRPDVFDGMTLDVPSGSRVALLGPSGSGKSTLAALALRLAAPQSGRILLGGTDIATLAAGDLRQRITYLSQATHLFDDTIRANLLLARPEAAEEDLWAALEAARIADTVHSLPDGLETWVGEAGARFSGGQGRRLALARTLLSAAPILILDEPCAGLDADTERAFLQTLNETAVGRTVILIAHRLTGVERFDRIWRLSEGRAAAAAG